MTLVVVYKGFLIRSKDIHGGLAPTTCPILCEIYAFLD